MRATISISTLTLLLLAGAQAASAIEPTVAPGEDVEARVDGDLDGDGAADLAYIVRAEAWRELRVALSTGDEVEALDLDPTALGPGSLSIEGNVLKFGDLTGGTTAVSSTRRFRYDGRGGRMRLIGIDATLYSRTFAHDGFETSWNLLNGDATTREMRVNRGSGDAAYLPAREQSFKRRTRAVWLVDSPDPDTLVEEMRGD